MTICIDAGHSRGQNRSPAVPAYVEGDQMFLLQRYLRAALLRYGFGVICTRRCPEDDPGLSRRGATAEACSLFLSLHSAAGTPSENVDEVRVWYPANGPEEHLARELSEVVAAVMCTVQPPRHCPSSSSGHGDCAVLPYVAAEGSMALVVEHSFHTQRRAALWLLSRANLRRLAEAEAALLAEYFGMEAPEVRYELLKDVKNDDYRRMLTALLDRGLLESRGGSGGNTVIDLGEDALRLLLILGRAGLLPLS